MSREEELRREVKLYEDRIDGVWSQIKKCNACRLDDDEYCEHHKTMMDIEKSIRQFWLMELQGIHEERKRLCNEVNLIIDTFISESSVDVRMICFEFHDSDVRDLKEQLKKAFGGD